MSSSSSSSPEVPTIQLDAHESAILDLIHRFTLHLGNARPDLPAVECRVAGGWVRDKLLGLESDDLDICISSLTGHHFATLLEGYLHELRERPDGNGLEEDDSALMQSTRIAKIQANPDQSKHLETARMTVGGLEIDLVQLRSEEYADGGANCSSNGEGGSSGSGSRIPTSVKFGTPLEDALRRDITINTLFYNVHSRLVEDQTGKGLADLLSSSPLIRTPLEPLQTFLDDPLRILRCIRFASRFSFPLNDDIKPAVEDERVRTALLAKVSKERIGVELDKMLKGPDPLLALRLIHHLSLYHLLFSPLASAGPPSAPLPEGAGDQALLAGEILQDILREGEQLGVPHALLSPLREDKAARKKLWLAVALSPLKGLTYTEKKKTLPLSDAVIRDSVKLPNAERAFVGHIFSAADKLSHPTLERFAAQPARERSAIGLLLRDGDVHDANSGLDWRSSVLFALVMGLQPVWADKAAVHAVVQTYAAFVARVLELELDRRAFDKPLLDGKEISSVLGQFPGKLGRLLAVLLSRVVEWQLNNPAGGKDACGEYIKAEYEAGRVALPDEPAPAQKQPVAKPPKKKRKDSLT